MMMILFSDKHLQHFLLHVSLPLLKLNVLTDHQILYIDTTNVHVDISIIIFVYAKWCCT